MQQRPTQNSDTTVDGSGLHTSHKSLWHPFRTLRLAPLCCGRPGYPVLFYLPPPLWKNPGSATAAYGHDLHVILLNSYFYQLLSRMKGLV